MRIRRSRGIGLGLIAAIAVATPAAAAEVFPASTGADGPCDFTSAGLYTVQTSTGLLTRPDASTQTIGASTDGLRTLNCTTISVGPATTLRFSGQHAPNLLATAIVQIDGIIDGVPVVEEGRLVGVLSRAVLQRRLAEDEPPSELAEG